MNASRQNSTSQGTRSSTAPPDNSWFWGASLLVFLLAAFCVWVLIARRTADSDTILDPIPNTPTQDASKETSDASSQPASGDSQKGSQSTKAPDVRDSGMLSLPEKPDDVTVEELQGELRSVAADLEKKYPSRVDALHAAAMIYSELGQSAKAEELWTKAVAAKPAEIGPYLGLAKALGDRGDNAGASRVLEDARNAGRKSDQLYLDLGAALSKQGLLDQAETIFVEGTLAYPKSANLPLQLGIAQLQLRKFAESETQVRKAIELGNQSDQAWITLANALARQGKTEEAAEVRKKVIGSSSRSDASNKPTEFQDAYASALRSIAVNMLVLAAGVEDRGGARNQAREHLLRAVALKPSELTTYMELSSHLRMHQQMQDALQVQQKLLELQPKNVFNYMNLASVASLLGDSRQAREVLVRATNVAPDFPAAYGELAKLDLLARDYNSAVRNARKARDLEPRNIEWYMMVSVAARALGDHVESDMAIATAMKISPNDPRLRSMGLSAGVGK